MFASIECMIISYRPVNKHGHEEQCTGLEVSIHGATPIQSNGSISHWKIHGKNMWSSVVQWHGDPAILPGFHMLWIPQVFFAVGLYRRPETISHGETHLVIYK